MIEAVSQRDIAVARARLDERQRILELLALAEPAISEDILKAISRGTAALHFRRRAPSARTENGPDTAAAPVAGAGRWSDVTSRLNAERRADHVATDSEGSPSPGRSTRLAPASVWQKITERAKTGRRRAASSVWQKIAERVNARRREAGVASVAK